MKRSPQLILLAIAVLAGCSKSATEPGDSSSVLPPSLVATAPVARATGVLYDTEIWGEFDHDIDAATVNTKSVFLKLDGQRIPVSVAYDSVTRRISVDPSVTLALLRTYTVEFTPTVVGRNGVALPEGVYFQFTTNSLRRPAYDYPINGAVEGPLVTLGWGGTQAHTNGLLYELYAGTDSLQVAARTTPKLQHNVFTRFVPGTPWPAGQRVYWAITSHNSDTGELLPGPVQSFEVLDSSVPVQTVDLFLRDWGSNDIRNRNTQFCNRVTIPVGPGFNAGVHWDYNRLPTGARIVGATMALYFPDPEAGSFNSVQPVTAWIAQNDWVACNMVAPGPPYAELSGLLATATSAGPQRVEFTSARLAAFFEAQARERTLLPGLLIRGNNTNFNFSAPAGSDPSVFPRVTVRYQMPPVGVGH